MKISNLRIKGFKSFGINEGVNIPLNNNLAAFIGLNSAGKRWIRKFEQLL